MAKLITCPACGNRGEATVDESGAFEVRGYHFGKPVRKCNQCGAGVFLRMFGGPELIDAELWARMTEAWEREFGSE